MAGSLSQAVAPHLPQLRRFARALTGSQKGGDAYVVETLEAIVVDPLKIDISSDVRCDLFKVFLDLWRADVISDKSNDNDGSAGGVGTKRRLETVPVLPRVALLLTALEGFEVSDVARMVNCSTDEAKALLNTANAEIARQIATDVLIIEDEPLIALDLQIVVEDLGHQVSDVARTRQEVIKSVEHRRPGLILADIRLGDGSSGLDAVNDILGMFEVPVIFITAYPELFLTGGPPEPAFLLAKPFSVETLRAVISQVLFFDRKAHRRRAA